MCRAHAKSFSQIVTLLLPKQSEKRDSDPSSISSTYKQIFQVVKLPSVMRLALLLMLCKVRSLCVILVGTCISVSDSYGTVVLHSASTHSYFADWNERGRLSHGGCAAGVCIRPTTPRAPS